MTCDSVNTRIEIISLICGVLITGRVPWKYGIPFHEVWFVVYFEGVGMYCRNCGKEVADQAVMCVSCGVPPKNGKNFCQNCGEASVPGAEICAKCGVRPAQAAGEGRDWLTTLLLCIFVGGLGIHRFYTGHTVIGIIQLLTLGGCGIWTIVDLILIITGSFKDSEGNPLVRKM